MLFTSIWNERCRELEGEVEEVETLDVRKGSQVAADQGAQTI